MVTILVVDDDRMNGDLLKAVLTRQGYQVITATNGREGLRLFREQPPRVTLLDLRMPEMDGLTVLREIRALDPEVAVIILGGGTTDVQENQARELGVTDFVRRGLSLDVLVDAVNRAVHQPVKQPFTSTSPQAFAARGETGEAILVVDDEPMVRDLLIRFLNLRGFHVRGAKDGAEALSMIAADPPDLVLVDLVMPGMSGVEVLEALRARHFAGTVVVLSDSHSEDLLDQAWALGPQETLSKPIDLDRLLTVIQLVLVCREC